MKPRDLRPHETKGQPGSITRARNRAPCAMRHAPCAYVRAHVARGTGTGAWCMVHVARAHGAGACRMVHAGTGTWGMVAGAMRHEHTCGRMACDTCGTGACDVTRVDRRMWHVWHWCMRLCDTCGTGACDTCGAGACDTCAWVRLHGSGRFLTTFNDLRAVSVQKVLGLSVKVCSFERQIA